MLDAHTTKRLDDCRDILVGKVPDPKSQVEQITSLLIDKFMNGTGRVWARDAEPAAAENQTPQPETAEVMP